MAVNRCDTIRGRSAKALLHKEARKFVFIQLPKACTDEFIKRRQSSGWSDEVLARSVNVSKSLALRSSNFTSSCRCFRMCSRYLVPLLRLYATSSGLVAALPRCSRCRRSEDRVPIALHASPRQPWPCYPRERSTGIQPPCGSTAPDNEDSTHENRLYPKHRSDVRLGKPRKPLRYVRSALETGVESLVSLW